jgi:hypothetical protein
LGIVVVVEFIDTVLAPYPDITIRILEYPLMSLEISEAGSLGLFL